MRWMLAALLMSGPVVGQEVHRCDEVAIAEMLAEPFEDSAKAFANGDVSLSVLDIEEPAAAAFYLQIQSPPYDESGDKQCVVISNVLEYGFARLSLDDITSSYDPETGLTMNLTAFIYDPEAAWFQPTPLQITLNQATGAIGAMLK